MKIRAGFVSNSSSTSFLIIAKEELNEASFLELMGVAPDSPLVGIFRTLLDDVIGQARVQVNFAEEPGDMPIEAWFEGDRLSPRMMAKLREAKAKGLRAYVGKLNSDESPVQSFFCVDSFEVENDKIYFNALECGW